LFLALTLLGEPASIQTSASLATTGADEECFFKLIYPETEALLQSSIIADTPREAAIVGTEGSIHFRSPWYRETSIELRKNNGETQQFTFPATGNGFEPEIREAMDCVRNGRIESKLMPHAFSLLQSKVLDLLCKEAGIVYP
jgi:predicted dehydrogenase